MPADLSVLTSSRGRFVPSDGGHAPGHLREAFLEVALPDSGERVEWFDEQQQAAWDAATQEQRLGWVTGQLWNCTDVMPSFVCTELDLQMGSTYAMAARQLRQ